MRAVLLLLAAPAVQGSTCSAGQTAAQVVQGSDLTGQVVLYTGGDSGIGYEAALAVARTGARVIIASYDAAGKGASAAAGIARLTGNTQVSVVGVDLSSFASVRACVAGVLALTSRIDVVVADAGIECVRPATKPCVPASEITADGFERVVQTNYLGHFLMVELLLPTLRASRGRVVAVASSSAKFACSWRSKTPVPAAAGRAACMDAGKLDHLVRSATPGTNYFLIPSANYGASKYLMIFWMAELARREPLVDAYSMHPGIVMTSLVTPTPAAARGIWCDSERLDPNCAKCPTTSAAVGAATLAYLTATPAAQLSDGAYYTYCAVNPTNVIEQRSSRTSAAKAAAYQSQVYNMSAAWVRAGGPAPPAPPAPPGSYVCAAGVCTSGAGGTLAACRATCGSPPPPPGPAQMYTCVHGQCVPASSGAARDVCLSACA